jgi:hypothetical protein
MWEKTAKSKLIVICNYYSTLACFVFGIQSVNQLIMKGNVKFRIDLRSSEHEANQLTLVAVTKNIVSLLMQIHYNFNSFDLFFILKLQRNSLNPRQCKSYISISWCDFDIGN